MRSPKKQHLSEKTKLHPQNKHRNRYNFKELIAAYPELAKFVHINKYKDTSIDFADPVAVKALNTALLKSYYQIDMWDIPKSYLCPAIPGRADHIHYIAELLGSYAQGKIPQGKKIRCLDIGVGANCVYPIIGTHEYGWSFIGSEIDKVAVASAKNIVATNPRLHDLVEIRHQTDFKNIFKGILEKDEMIDVCICNPPFHSSLAEAQAGTLRKLNNLQQKKVTTATLNFGGKHTELYCAGGEKRFAQYMIEQSKDYAGSCFIFSMLIAKKEHLAKIYDLLDKNQAREVHTLDIGHGNKISRIVTWTFLDQAAQQKWVKDRW